VPAVVDQPELVERPPVVELDIEGSSVRIWRGADADLVIAIIGALKRPK
jgi:hypothetical protein